jgi:seryl-tRNA(Sec) selenium transferase
MKTALVLSLVLGLAGTSSAQASSEDAWSGFQAEVSKACLAAAAGLIEKGKVLTDPYGSEHYGLAIVTGTAKGAKTKGAKTTISTICVFDKKTRQAEIGGEIAADRLTVKADR